MTFLTGAYFFDLRLHLIDEVLDVLELLIRQGVVRRLYLDGEAESPGAELMGLVIKLVVLKQVPAAHLRVGGVRCPELLDVHAVRVNLDLFAKIV